MGYRDQHFDYIRKRLWLPPHYIQSMDTAAATPGVAFETAGVTPAEITDVGFGTLIMTDAELLNGYIPVPFDLDPKHAIGFQIYWTMDHDGAGTGLADWILLVGTTKRGVAIALPATALDTVIANDTNTDSGILLIKKPVKTMKH